MQLAGRTVLAGVALSAACGDGPSEPSPEEPLRYHRVLSMPQNSRVDLDNGTVRPPDALADIWFEAQSRAERYLVPFGGARAAILGERAPGKGGCTGASLSAQSIDMEGLPAGTFLCVLTNGERISQVEVIDVPRPSPDTLVVVVTTFAHSADDVLPDPPTLVSPPQDSAVYQYANAPHCANAAEPYGYEITYVWTSIPDVARYEIYSIGPTALAPILDNELVLDTTFTRARCGSYVASRNTVGWTWWITAVLRDSTRLQSDWGSYNFTDPFQP